LAVDIGDLKTAQFRATDTVEYRVMSIVRWKRLLAESMSCATSSGLKTSGSLR
jgi:hypothetical protein